MRSSEGAASRTVTAKGSAAVLVRAAASAGSSVVTALGAIGRGRNGW